MAGLKQKYTVPKFWIMLEKEFKDDKDKLVSSVCKYDSSSGNLSYCGTICLQMNDEAVLKPTTEFFNMILYNSDPNSKVYLRRFLNPANVTKVSPQDDIEGINNFDIFVIQVKVTPNRTYLCMEATYPYAPNKASSLWHKRAGVASL